MRSQQQAWYIDNRFYFTKDFTDEFIKNAIEIINSGNEVIGANLKDYYPQDGNVSSRITAAHNFGLLDGKSRLSDSAILYNSGCISYSDLLIELMFKRNAFKETVVNIKPFVLLCILFHKMNDINIPEEERFITAAECYEYLTPIEKYEELTVDLVNKIVTERQYPPNKKVPVTRIKNIKNGVYLSSIFTALKDSGICLFGLQKSIIHPNPICYDFYEYISTNANGISGYEAIEGDDLYDYLCDIRKGLYEIVPHLNLKKGLVPNDTQGFYEYIFGINRRPSFDPSNYFEDECYGVYKSLFCAKGIILAYIYLLDSRTGELLFDFNNQAVYERIFEDGKIMIKTPFLTTEHTSVKELIKEEESLSLTPEWFRTHASEFDDVLLEAEIQYDDFQSKFAPEVLATLSGEDLLRKMFYSEATNKDNLCYYLEFHTKVRELFGSVAGGSAYKFNLFYQKKKSSWVTGSSAKPKLLTLDEAIVLGTEIRDALVKGAEIIKANQGVSDAEGYNKLYTQLFATLGKYINLLWVQKYYHMIFPDMFPVFYNEAWQRHVLTKLNIEPYDSGFVRMGQISLFVNKCEIENVVFAQIIYKYLNMVEDENTGNDDSSDATEENEDKNVEEVRPFIELNFTTNIDCDFERNRIVFGAPGTGKSFQMEEDRAKLVEMGGGYERVTFHPDYTYSSFVGCYKPVSEKGKIEYKYVPGPFMRVLVEALRSGLTDNPKPYLLVIEEINRAKVAAVFGEVFQLLDRDSKGTSDYEIHTSEDVKKYLSDELNGSLESFARIRIPNNMFIWASMNSADQGVFPMDTAFKRRWSFEYKGIDENEDKVGGLITLGQGEHEFEVNWNVLRKAINEVLAKKFNINEDKLMGPFFMSEDVFAFDEKGYIKNPAKFKRVFKSKVIMYLYEDAAKQQKHKLFAGCDSTKYSSICDAFDKIGIDIFGADFKDTYKDME